MYNKKKRNPLVYLCVLGLIGLLGIPTGNLGMFGFFGFFGFSSFAGSKTDEFVLQAAAKAGLWAFITSLTGLSVSIIVISTIRTLEAAALSIAIIYIISLFTFIIVYYLTEKRGIL